jgi:hypothetical protein
MMEVITHDGYFRGLKQAALMFVVGKPFRFGVFHV